MPKGDSGHRSTVITGVMRPLVDYFGGVTKMADTLAVSRRTVLRWGLGETTPDEVTRAWLNEYARVAKVKEPYDAKGRLRKA
jgi:hypothetical protein